MNKKIPAAVTAAAIGFTAICFTGCGNDDKKGSSSGSIMNYTAPEEGEDIVVLSVKDRGDIKIKLFPDLLSKACENFTTHVKDGYYDELIFHRVIDDFMIQGGDPKGNGTGGESIWGGDFDGGTSDQLIHVTGAVAYANSGSTSTDGSQFYIVTGSQADEITDEYITNIVNNYKIDLTDESKELYQKYGGSPYLDGNYTVFGQVIDGLDIAYDIAATTEKDSNDKPFTSIVIEKAEVVPYDGFEIKMYPDDYDSLKK